MTVCAWETGQARFSVPSFLRLLFYWASEAHEGTKEKPGLRTGHFLKRGFGLDSECSNGTTFMRPLQIKNKATLQAWNACSAGQ